MLYLTRKIGESLIINDEIEVTLVEVKGKSAKLGITFPEHATVLRREVYERIQAENEAAATASTEAVADALKSGLGNVLQRARPKTPQASSAAPAKDSKAQNEPNET